MNVEAKRVLREAPANTSEKLMQDARAVLAQNNIAGTERMSARVLSGLKDNGVENPNRIQLNDYVKKYKQTLDELALRDKGVENDLVSIDEEDLIEDGDFAAAAK